MKKIALVILAIFSLPFPAPASESSPQCEALATSLVRSIVLATNGNRAADYVHFHATGRRDETKMSVITVQAYALNGEDSDTYEEYELTFRTTGAPKTCATLVSLKLVGEN